MRRQVVLSAAACGALAPSLVACSSSTREQEAAHALRRPITAQPSDRVDLMRELVRYATLAPSSHNTQCWTFHLQDRAIVIAPDLSRRCLVVDPKRLLGKWQSGNLAPALALPSTGTAGEPR